ncbi:MAG: hypothetical protein HY840_13755 [Bacteroidetes bacterium]|nr:hypothetical protein [Bacteroidota bacterium]
MSINNSALITYVSLNIIIQKNRCCFISFLLFLAGTWSSVYAQNNTAFSYKQSAVFKNQKTAIINLSEVNDDPDIQIEARKEEETPNRFQHLDSVKNILNQKRTTANSGNPTYWKQSYNKTNSIPAYSLLNNFQGNYQNGVTPNDNHIAVSNAGIIVSVVNTNIRIFNDTGKILLSKTFAQFASFLGPLTHTFDPRIIYDPVADKFIMIFLNGSNSTNTNLIVAFSKTNNPVGNWNFYRLDGNVRKDTTWSDFPIVGFSNDELFVTLNLWNDHETCWDCDPTDAIIWQINKSSGYQGDSLISKYYGDIKVNNRIVWNICPMNGGSAPYGPNMYFVANRNIPVQNDSIFLIEISNTLLSQQATLSAKTCKSNVSYGIQPHARQPDGSYLRTDFCDVQSGFFEHGKILFVGNSIDTTTKGPGIFFGTINNPQATAPIVDAKIFSFDTLDINYPSIAFAGNNFTGTAAIINFLHTSSATFAGISSVFVNDSGVFSPVLRVKSGISSVDMLYDSIERWGDYTGIQRVYNDPGTCWLSGSFAFSNGAISTWIAKVKSNDSKLGIPQEPTVLASFNLYPNPSHDYITIDFTNFTNTAVGTVEITDMSGRKKNWLKIFLLDKEKTQ